MKIKSHLFFSISMFFSILFLDAASVFGDKLRLVNGKSFDCTFISQTIQRETGNPISIIRIRLSDGTELDFRRSEVEFVQLDSGEIIMGSPTNIDKVDPLASRYLYAPSSFSLKKGEMYVSQKELFFTSVARGLTDNITILGGGVLPLLIAGDFFLISGGKISTRIRRNFRASAGFEVLSASDVNFGFMFGGGTYSGQNFHVSLIGGKPFAFGFGERELGPFLTVVGLNKKVTQRLRFVSETWFIPDIMEGSGKEKKTYWLSGNVIRFLINNSFALDSGFIFFEDGGGNSIPWIDFAYVF